MSPEQVAKQMSSGRQAVKVAPSARSDFTVVRLFREGLAFQDAGQHRKARKCFEKSARLAVSLTAHPEYQKAGCFASNSYFNNLYLHLYLCLDIYIISVNVHVQMDVVVVKQCCIKSLAMLEQYHKTMPLSVRFDIDDQAEAAEDGETAVASGLFHAHSSSSGTTMLSAVAHSHSVQDLPKESRRSVKPVRGPRSVPAMDSVDKAILESMQENGAFAPKAELDINLKRSPAPSRSKSFTKVTPVKPNGDVKRSWSLGASHHNPVAPAVTIPENEISKQKGKVKRPEAENIVYSLFRRALNFQAAAQKEAAQKCFLEALKMALSLPLHLEYPQMNSKRLSETCIACIEALEEIYPPCVIPERTSSQKNTDAKKAARPQSTHEARVTKADISTAMVSMGKSNNHSRGKATVPFLDSGQISPRKQKEKSLMVKPRPFSLSAPSFGKGGAARPVSTNVLPSRTRTQTQTSKTIPRFTSCI